MYRINIGYYSWILKKYIIYFLHKDGHKSYVFHKCRRLFHPQNTYSLCKCLKLSQWLNLMILKQSVKRKRIEDGDVALKEINCKITFASAVICLGTQLYRDWMACNATATNAHSTRFHSSSRVVADVW